MSTISRTGELTSSISSRVKVYLTDKSVVLVRCFYLFAHLVPVQGNKFKIDTMCLCDGKALNDDIDHYLSITGTREKAINLGSYGDGANRNRPMMHFSNPLGSDFVAGKSLLIHSENVSHDAGLPDSICMIGGFKRALYAEPSEDSTINPKLIENAFYFYCLAKHHDGETLSETPFSSPKKRTTKTTSRGVFKLPI